MVSEAVPATSRARANRRRMATSPSVPAVPSKAVTTTATQPSKNVGSTHVLVLRHGQSEWNALGRWQGQADPPLTDLGRQQAQMAARLLATECPTFDAVITSDLDRARETGSTIADVLGCDVRRLDPRWRENHAGEWQGLTPDEIRQQWPGYLENDRRPPGFESAASTVSRTCAALDDIAQRHSEQCILVVSHGGVLRLLQNEFTGTQQRFPNLAGSWFEHGRDVNGRSGWKMGSLLFPLQRVAIDGRIEGPVE